MSIVFKYFSTPLLLSEDFPLDKKGLFASFVLFSKEINAVASQKWLEHSAPVRYEDFLSAVTLSLSYISEFKANPVYAQRLLEDFFIPLSADINQLNYRGYKPQLDERFFNSLRRYVLNLQQRQKIDPRYTVGVPRLPIQEAAIAKLYADTFLCVVDKQYLDPYFLPASFRSNSFLNINIIDGGEYFDWVNFYLSLLDPIAKNTKTFILKNEINKIYNRICHNMIRVLTKTTQLSIDGEKNVIELVLTELAQSRQIIKEIVGYEVMVYSLDKMRNIDNAINGAVLDAEAGATILHGLDVHLLNGREFKLIFDNSVKNDTRYLIMDKFLPANAHIRVLSIIIEELSCKGHLDKLRAIREHMLGLSKALSALPPNSYSFNYDIADPFDNIMVPHIYVSYGDWELKNIEEVTKQ